MTAAFSCFVRSTVMAIPITGSGSTAGAIATVIDFLNTTKYPPSLRFLLMTLGPAAMLCAFADRITGWPERILATFGRVPFAFYIAHFFLIHTLSVLLGVAQGFRASQMMTLFLFYPKGYGVCCLASTSCGQW